MTVYIDDMRLPASVGAIEGRWSHLMTDGPTEELVAFAARLGMRRAWIQYEGTVKEHFDLTDNKRTLAIRLGAVPITYGAEGVALMKAKRAGERFDLAAYRAAADGQDALF